MDCFDDSKPYLLLFSSNDETFNVDSAVSNHKTLSHYCCLDTFQHILCERTLRMTCLNNPNLNDMYEHYREDITQFSGSIFISCFTHLQDESTALWLEYGGKDRATKLLLRFKNFATNFSDVLSSDYCLSSDNKKIYFQNKIPHGNGREISIQGNPRVFYDVIKDECTDGRAHVQQLRLFDIDYKKPKDDVLNKRNYSTTNMSNEAGVPIITSIPTYNTEILGKYKTIPWAYENESRIMCILSPECIDYYKYLYLRLEECIFSNMEIILSPWADSSLNAAVLDIISSANLSDKVKSSITISQSDVYSQLNF